MARTADLASDEMWGQGSVAKSMCPLATASKICCSVSPQNGGTPLSRMYRITPQLQMSASLLYLRFSTCTEGACSFLYKGHYKHPVMHSNAPEYALIVWRVIFGLQGNPSLASRTVVAGSLCQNSQLFQQAFLPYIVSIFTAACSS